MLRFIGRRILQAVPVLIGVTLLSFLLLHLTPGDPARISLGPHAPQSAVNFLREQLGLNKPLPTQYVNFIAGAAHFDFGASVANHLPVRDLVGPRILPTLWLLALAVFFSLLLGIPLATLSALKRNRAADHAIRVGTTITYAMPTFWVGLLLTLLVSVKLGLLPSSGYGTTFGDHIRGLILPAATVALFVTPLVVRSLRSSMIETMGAEFVEAARARGFSAARVMTRHVFRNSLISTVTLLAVLSGALLSGAVVVENVFAIPGLGSLLVESVSSRDFPVVQALTLVFGVVVILLSLGADLLYAMIDPRVRL